MDAEELVRLRLEMEFGVAPHGNTLPPAVVNLDGQPRLVVSWHRDGASMFFRYDVPDECREQVRQIGVERGLVDEAAVRDALGQVEHVWRVRWYTIERRPRPDAYPDVVLRGGRHVVLIDGEVAAQAWTTAESERAVEVEVETHPDFRRRGFAAQVVSAWSAAELARGRVAFYSHVTENEASAGVARHLGLVWLSDEVEFQ
jgi:predicted GNAT family acetyltransferase